MHRRYRNQEIAYLFSDENKLNSWQAVELAVLEAKARLKLIPENIYLETAQCLLSNPIDLEWWRKRDAEINHDLNAFLDERLRFLPVELHQYFHSKMTSYDTEEPAFAVILKKSLEKVFQEFMALRETIDKQALKHRFTLMLARTHGQGAELQSFGKCLLAWRQDCLLAFEPLEDRQKSINYTKLSGAIGNYGGLSPEVEKEALDILKLEPYYGATQIMPRVLYAPIAQGLMNLVLVMHKIALDIRLGARSGQPILQEPFGQKQKGSSAMPHKKNPISLEQMEGLARLATGYAGMATANIVTWEERAIEQSCVERVAWPDLFHVVLRALKVMQKTLSGLTVYSDNMIKEILDSKGTYASSGVKEFLKAELGPLGFGHEDTYRLVQLACFNIFEPSAGRLKIRLSRPKSLKQAKNLLSEAMFTAFDNGLTLESFLPKGKLSPSPELEISQEQIKRFNQALDKLFQSQKVQKAWEKLFDPAEILKQEEVLFREILS